MNGRDDKKHSRLDAMVSDVDRPKPAKLEYETQDMTPTSRPSLLRHSWQFLIWAPVLIGLAAAIVLPLIARGCAALK